jgi:hypothetical protein
VRRLALALFACCALLAAMRIAERRGKCIAAVALARKLAGILFAMTQARSLLRATQAADELSPLTSRRAHAA